VVSPSTVSGAGVPRGPQDMPQHINREQGVEREVKEGAAGTRATIDDVV